MRLAPLVALSLAGCSLYFGSSAPEHGGPPGVPVYARAKFGQPFQRVISQYWADLTTTTYSCGVAIP